MSPATVNACYVPSQNSINSPAAILRKPFYDKDGNLVNWWTDEDREAFRKRTKAVGERYAMYEILDGESPNADLVITETVADLAGASVALDVLEKKRKRRN